MKIAVVCISRREERYCNEWINHYLNLGFDKIFWGDNNRQEIDEDILPYINKYIDDGVLEYIDLKDNNDGIQTKFYDDVYKYNKNDYDWFLFVDIDEFLTIPETNNDVKSFLSQECFINTDVIRIPWRPYDDNDLLYYEDKPVMERFTREYTKAKNICCKSFVKGIGGNKTIHIIGVHMPHRVECKGYNIDLVLKNNNGEVFISEAEDFHNDKYYKRTDSMYDYAYLKHYRHKTIEEYLTKITKGKVSTKNALEYWINKGPEENLKKFNTMNLTKEKISLFNDLWKHLITNKE